MKLPTRSILPLMTLNTPLISGFASRQLFKSFSRQHNNFLTSMFSSISKTSCTSNIFGGDYGGQKATFSSVDGKLIPVPEHMVPESMVEWGQIPSCFEVIVSEDITNDNEDESQSTLQRSIVTVMPEVGCGLDNLDTMKNIEKIPFNQYETFQVNDMNIATAFIKEEGKRCVECIFVNEKEGTKNGEEVLTTIRMRVSVNLFDNNQIKSPIHVTREEKTSDTSSSGTIADGGGLDARTVSRLVGRENANKPFCEEELAETFETDADSTTLKLPCGLQVKYSSRPLSSLLEVGLKGTNPESSYVVVKHDLESLQASCDQE